jgi:hypothetical protein
VQNGAVVQDNIPYTYNGSAWEPSTADKAYIPFGRGVIWLVYYPYSPDMDDKTTEPEILDAFTVPADQGSQDKYTASDLMIGSGSLSVDNTLTATLTHRLAM